MIHFNRKNLAILVIWLIGLTITACQKENSAKTDNQQLKKQLKSETNSFFSEAILESDVAADKDVICPGATPEEAGNLNHPQIVRGSVVAPRQQASFGFPFINEAHAVPIAGEFPAPKVSVKLMEGFAEPKVVSETTTDALGRFCLKLSWNATFDENHYIEAKIGDEKLRRLSPTQKVAIVSTQSEAVFRLFKQNLKNIALKRNTAINLQTIADTQVDTLNPAKAQSTIEDTVELLIQNLSADIRVQKSLGLNNSSGQN